MPRDEDSRRHVKRDATNADGLATELVAFANSDGGWLFLGMNGDGPIAGLGSVSVRRRQAEWTGEGTDPVTDQVTDQVTDSVAPEIERPPLPMVPSITDNSPPYDLQ